MKARACERPLHRLACMHAHGRTSSPARLSDGASDTTPCLTRGTPRCATRQPRGPPLGVVTQEREGVESNGCRKSVERGRRRRRRPPWRHARTPLSPYTRDTDLAEWRITNKGPRT